MKKRLISALALCLVLLLAVPSIAGAANTPDNPVRRITNKAEYDTFEAKYDSNNSAAWVGQGLRLNADAKDGWYLEIYEPVTEGTVIELAVKKGSTYEIMTYTVEKVPGEVRIGDGRGNGGVNHVKLNVIAPEPDPDPDPIMVNLCFYAFLDNAWWYGLNYAELHPLGIEITPNWDAVYDAYATQANVTPGWFQADKVLGWQSSGIVSQYFEGARPTIILTQDLIEQHTMIVGETLVIVLDPVFAVDPDPDPVVNLGFIGYYMFGEDVLSTSIHWQKLEKEGDMINWDAVDAAYAEWVAQGGLAPDRTIWQTSGYASYTFEDYAALGYGDFTLGQLEGYYLAYYVDPGYLLPSEPVVVNLGFVGYYLFEGNVLSTSIHWQLLEEGDMVDWNAVDAAYAEWVAGGGLEPDRSTWQTSGYASFTFDDYAALGFGDFTLGQLEGFYLSYYVDPGYKLPVDPPNPPGNNDDDDQGEDNDNQGGKKGGNNQGSKRQGGNNQGGNNQGGNNQGGNNQGGNGQGGNGQGGNEDDQGEDNNNQGGNGQGGNGQGGNGQGGGSLEDGDNDVFDPGGGNSQGGNGQGGNGQGGNDQGGGKGKGNGNEQ